MKLLKKIFRENKGEVYFLCLHLGLAIIVNYLIEAISRHSLEGAYIYGIERWQVFLYNSFLIFVTYSLVYIVRRRIFFTVLISALWLLGGIINGAVLSYRVTPFIGTDVKLIKNAMSILTKYMSTAQVILVMVAAVCFIIAVIVLGIRGKKYKGIIKYKRTIVFIAVLFFSIIPVTRLCINARILSSYFGNISIAYEDYGFPYCFWSTVLATGINCPNEYSESTINNILKKDGEDSYNEEVVPNIVFLQLESFFDPALVKYLEFSEDPIPNFRYLKKNYSSGYLTVPSVGAGTANTEFEIITGMSLRYFGPGEYPYKTVLKDQVCESINYVLKDIGYAAHAIHNNEASFYGRKDVFTNLGFDTFTSEEYMNITETTPLGWAKDNVLTGEIMDALKSTKESDLVYTISVQGHGGYPSEQISSDPEIVIGGVLEEERKNAIEYYVNQIHEMDVFIGELIEELSNYDEDVLLVMFGDHLPSLGLEARTLENRSIYQTEYVIWDNMGLEAKDENLKSYQLAAVTLEKVDIHLGTVMKYHQERRGTKNYWRDLEALQYDMLYGEQYVYNGEISYEKTDLRLGVKDIKIVRAFNSLEKTAYVIGENFNSFSKVYINGEAADTTYISESKLKINDCILESEDLLTVNQVSESGKSLSSGITYVYK